MTILAAVLSKKKHFLRFLLSDSPTKKAVDRGENNFRLNYNIALLRSFNINICNAKFCCFFKCFLLVYGYLQVLLFFIFNWTLNKKFQNRRKCIVCSKSVETRVNRRSVKRHGNSQYSCVLKLITVWTRSFKRDPSTYFQKVALSLKPQIRNTK